MSFHCDGMSHTVGGGSFEVASARSCAMRAVFATVLVLAATAGLNAVMPPAVMAALPDGRIYEQVSPADKNGNVVHNLVISEAEGAFGLAEGDGNAVVFTASGAMGDAVSSILGEFVSRRSTSGWATSSAIPRQQGFINLIDGGPPETVVPSQDFSHFLFGATQPYVAAEPLTESSSNVFLSADPTVEPTWVAAPISDPPAFTPIPAPGRNKRDHNYLIVGGTPSFETVYFTYSGTLIPQDATRAPFVGNGLGGGTDPWGFYEWKGGTLSEAGVLPDGTLNPYGAVPAAIAGGNNFARGFAKPFDQAQTLDNQMSIDGSRVFFMSPDPVADLSECTAATPGGCTPELYVRKTAPDGSKSTVLVSASQLAGHEGEPAADSLVKIGNAPIDNGVAAGETYVYASPDGSHAFFKSTDRLTSAAPSDSAVKEYDFNVDDGSLTYLPGVEGPIVASSPNGSGFIFENTATTPTELDLWTPGTGGGEVTTVAQLLGPPNVGDPFAGAVDVSGGRSSASGSVFAFRTNSSLPGGFNNAGGFAQVYLYDVGGHELTCVSCPPLGLAPSGDVHVSYNNAEGGKRSNGDNTEPMTTLDTRVMSSDGKRVFFDTPDPLVPQDTNGERDVYEWENGSVFLISAGKGTEGSYLLDSSANGDDVFFATAQGLLAGDVDAGYDAYDARIPQAGDTPPPAAVPCQGDVCQGPPSVPTLLGTPASATFSGAGNLAPPEAKPPRKTTTKTVKCKRGFVKKKNKCVRKPKVKSHKGGK